MISFTDSHSLVDNIGEELTVKHLDKLEAVEIVHDMFDTDGGKEMMIYFMADGSVKKLRIEELLIKSTKELKYVHYLLKVKNQATKKWSDMILAIIRMRFLDRGNKYDGNYKPLYIDFKGNEVEMQRNKDFIEVLMSIRQLTLYVDGEESAFIILDDLQIVRSSIQNLRAAIYMINEEDEELKNLKVKLVQILENKAEWKLLDFLKKNLFYQRISN